MTSLAFFRATQASEAYFEYRAEDSNEIPGSTGKMVLTTRELYTRGYIRPNKMTTISFLAYLSVFDKFASGHRRHSTPAPALH